MRRKTQLANPDNISDIEAGKFFVEREVEEYALWVRQRWHACVSFPERWKSQAPLLDWKA
jgi:hypothetical protein